MKVASIKKGFTLVEIMIVVAIIGIIIAIAVPAFLRARENARGRACQENLSKIDGAKEMYALEEKAPQGATVTFANLVQASGTGYLKTIPDCPALAGTTGATYTIGNIGVDPLCTYAATAAANTWAADHTLGGKDYVAPGA